MSNSATFEDFYQVPDLKFDINKLQKAYKEILAIKKFTGVKGISNFVANKGPIIFWP